MFLMLSIPNPFNTDRFKSLFEWHKVFGNKVLELQLFFASSILFEFEIKIEWNGRDHAGPSITFIIFGVGGELQFYDQRHWDFDKDDWEE